MDKEPPPDNGHRSALLLVLEAYRAALRRCHGRSATRRALGTGPLLAGRFHAQDFHTIRLFGAGKAAPAMAEAVSTRLCMLPDGRGFRGGWVVTKDGHAPPPSGSPFPHAPVEVLEAAHPLPDGRSVAAGGRLLREFEGLGPDDLAIFVLSGGASSLLEVPAPGLTLEALRRRHQELLLAGLSIEQINAERRRLSALKGGQLAAHTRATLLTLILSDVPGGGPEVVGSGPTLAGYPPADPRHHAVVVADHREALAEAAGSLRRRGVVILEESAGKLGERSARAHGEALASLARRRCGQRAALLWSGEAPVEVRGGGRGGRNQELALAAALALRGVPGVTVAALATDGQDGSTDAAGALVDGTTAKNIEERGLDPRRCLDDNDAYPALQAAGALVPARPTGTNVNDLCIALLEP